MKKILSDMGILKVALNDRWDWFLCTGLMVLTGGILAIMLNGCTGKAEPFQIGMVSTLTGSSSTSGVHARNAVILAVEQINRSGGIKGRSVELIIKDDKGNPDEALRVDTELVEEGVVAIIGHHLSTLSIKTVPLMNEKNVLMIATGTTTSELTGLDDNFIRLMIPDDRRAPLMADMAYNRLKVKTMAVVYDLSNPNYTVSLSRHFKKGYEKQGGKISALIAFNSQEKFSALDITGKIMNSDAEGVLLITNAIHGALICQHLRKNESEVKITASAWTFPEPDFIRNGGRAVEGITCLVELNEESTSESFLQFKEQYRDRFEEDVSINAQIGYEVAQVLFFALSKTDDSGKLKETILKQRVFRGVDSDIIIDKFGDPFRTLYIQEIRNGKIRIIGKIEPSLALGEK